MYSTNKIISLIGAFAFVTLSPMARAVDPPPDGGYPNGNTAEGEDALFSLTTGFSNTAIGYHAFYSNTVGYDSTAIGNGALANNTTGNNNTATGSGALTANTGGVQNTATGTGALANNTTGNSNTATGDFALVFNATGNNNTATGLEALQSTSGSNNTGTGVFALLNNSAGSNNIAMGANAGINLTTGSDNIYIGNGGGGGGESRKIRVGTAGTQTATFIAGISGVTVPDGVGVIVGANGKLGTAVSSERFKEAIKSMDKASEAILSLQPVTFHYKQELDPDGVPQFGLVAEEVEKVNPNLVARDAKGNRYTVRYDAVNAMLLNEFLKDHKKTEKLEATVANLIATVKEQAAQIQKVSAQLATGRVRPIGGLEASKPAPQVVSNQ